MDEATTTQLVFAAELATFVAALAGLAALRRPSALIRSEPARTRALLAFGGLAVTGALGGAVVAPDPANPVLAAVRVVSAVVLLSTLPHWGGRGGRLALGVGLLAVVASDGLGLADDGRAGALVQLAGALLVIVGLSAISRLSLTARLPVGAAVLVLFVALLLGTGLTLGLDGDVVVDRENLGRILFVLAAVVSLGALASAVFDADRLGRDLDLLTEAANRIQDGDTDVRVRVRSDDELAVLSDAFTSMASSIRVVSRGLETTVADETTVRARLEAVVAGMSEALLAVDADGVVIELNRAAEDLLAVHRADALGRPAADVVRWRLADGRAVPLAAADLADGLVMAADLAVGEDTVPVVVTAGALQVDLGDGAAADAGGGSAGSGDRRQRTGGRRAADRAGARVAGTSSGAGAVLVLRDVRREREVDDLKASILANISHELRTPLTPIKGYAGMLRDRDVGPERTKAFAAEIVDGVDQLERVVAQLVTFATIAAGRLSLSPAEVGVTDLADGLRTRWATRVSAPHELAVLVDGGDGGGDGGGGGAAVTVDATLLGQALDELVDNAVKYSPDGGPVTVTFDHFPGHDLTVTVVDTGIGMPPDRLDDLSEAFAQADASTTRAFNGLGLGLACADRIVRAHGGALSYTSAEQRGTTVTVVVPEAPRNPEAPAVPSG